MSEMPREPTLREVHEYLRHRILQAEMRTHALLTIVGMLFARIRDHDPQYAVKLLADFERMRIDHMKFSLKDSTPERSDMFAGEYQEAMDETLKFIEDHLTGKFAPSQNKDQ